MKYELLTLDVLGNDEDGYEVNDVYNKGIIEIEDDLSNLSIIKAIENEGYINIKDLIIEDFCDDSLICLDDKNGRPIFQLRKQEL